MKKLIILFMLIAVAAVSMAAVQDRSFVIKEGQNQIFRLPVFGAGDTIITSQTVTYTVDNRQAYSQHQVFSFDLTAVSGSPSVAITAYGRVTSTSAWVQIGTPITWTSNSEDGDISSTSPVNYNYLKVTFVASGATQKASIASFRVRTSNAAQIPNTGGTLIISRADAGTLTLTSADNNSDAALIVAAGGTGALTLGDANSTTAVTSSDWAIGATGIMTGIGAITGDGGATITGGTVNLNASSNNAVNVGTGSTNAAVSIGGGSNTVAVNSSAWDISTTGAVSGVTTLGASGVITATGGIALASNSTVHWAKGGAATAVATGTDTQPSNGARWWVEIEIPYNVTLTGLAYLVGSVGATDSVVVQLCNSAGTEVASSRLPTGNTNRPAALVGTAAEFQSVPFTTPYAAVAGKYYAVIQFNGNTARFRSYLIPGSKFIAGTAAGTWGTAAGITPGTTFTASKGPVLMTY